MRSEFFSKPILTEFCFIDTECDKQWIYLPPLLLCQGRQIPQPQRKGEVLQETHSTQV